MKGAKAFLTALILATLSGLAWGQFSPAFQSPGASEQFRLGVQAYHRGRYADSTLLFEKALAYEPSHSLLSWWLGRSYLKSGLGETALRLWAPLAQDPASPPFLQAEVEALKASLAVPAGGNGRTSYVEAARFSGIQGKSSYFLRPSALLPEQDGSVWVVAQGSNELLRIDPNGVIRERNRGGLQGLDRPFGIASLPGGSYFVTEFNGDRISRLGTAKPFTFGKTGRGEGQLLGPQQVACDEDGYLYVVDFGNARVVKFDADGMPILSFGAKLDDFAGFVSPAGLAVKAGVVYVADSYRKTVFKFDSSGNYLGSLADGLLHFPEGMSFWKNAQALLIADTDRIVSVDLESETVSTIYQSPDRSARLVCAAPDYNGNVLACDFDNSAVLVLTEAPQMAAGYDVEIERVDSSSFPKVFLDLSVKDRFGHPVVGLARSNFRLSERLVRKTSTDERGMIVEHSTETIAPIPGFDLLGSARSDSKPRITFLLDRSEGMALLRSEARDAVTALHEGLKSIGATSFALVGAGKVPSLMVGAGGSLAELTRACLREPDAGGPRFDSGLRLAISTMLPTSPKDVIVYVGTGTVDEKSFGSMTLSELGNYLGNNDISLFAVILGSGAPDASLRYLVERSGGAIYNASRARGLADLAEAVKTLSSGRYRFSFNSAADSGFGENYLMVAAEAYLYKKSGRDELGYFAPRK